MNTVKIYLFTYINHKTKISSGVIQAIINSVDMNPDYKFNSTESRYSIQMSLLNETLLYDVFTNIIGDTKIEIITNESNLNKMVNNSLSKYITFSKSKSGLGIYKDLNHNVTDFVEYILGDLHLIRDSIQIKSLLHTITPFITNSHKLHIKSHILHPNTQCSDDKYNELCKHIAYIPSNYTNKL